MNIRELAKSCSAGEFLIQNGESIDKKMLGDSGIAVKKIITTKSPGHIADWVVTEVGENYFNAVQVNAAKNPTVFRNANCPGFMEGSAHTFRHAKYMAPGYDIIIIHDDLDDGNFIKLIADHEADKAINLLNMKNRYAGE
jgi:hypothetical protein